MTVEELMKAMKEVDPKTVVVVKDDQGNREIVRAYSYSSPGSGFVIYS